jgi:hypothetical protein
MTEVSEIYPTEPRMDQDLEFQAYYVRLNALNELLSPMGRAVLELSWETAGSHEMMELRRSTIIGRLTADLIRALDMREVSFGEVKPGHWFVHSGVTCYTHQGNGRRLAAIRLRDGRTITGAVRMDCAITGTADSNMDEDDEISLVVGRMLTDTKFDLVVAGYRSPAFMRARLGARTIKIVDYIPGSVLDRIAHEKHLPVPEITFDGISDLGLLSAAIQDSMQRFKRAVEKEGMWRELYDKPTWKPAHESRHQSLFRLLSGLVVEGHGIKILPGTDQGAGQTDFTFTLRDAVSIVEFKKDYDTQRLIHGIQVQLPSYMESAGTHIGAYFVMCHERDPAEVIEIISRAAADVQSSLGLIISVETVDCRRHESASKRELLPSANCLANGSPRRAGHLPPRRAVPLGLLSLDAVGRDHADTSL